MKIKGFGAGPGTAKGPAIVILNKQDLTKVKEGDIIVTEMTGPDSIEAIMKAAAIITNRGGFTSHAAIMARELGKPAVVGTDNATQIIKTGDLLTVDATSGIVSWGEE